MGCANNIPTRYFPFNIFTFDEVKNQSQQVSIEMIKYHSNREQTLLNKTDRTGGINKITLEPTFNPIPLWGGGGDLFC